MLEYHTPEILFVIVLVAFLLDSIFGDPYTIPHPIIYIGRLISRSEKVIRKLIRNERLGGCVLVVIVIIVSGGLPLMVVWMLAKVHIMVAVAVEMFMCFQILAMTSLEKESMKVHQPVVEENIDEARKYLSYIVGRDTGGLDFRGIIKATVETIAENTTDGVIAPLIFICIGGAPLGFIYKSINTMDSMVGYKNEQYLRFGTCAAKLDDVVNFIPARVTAFAMIIAAKIGGFNWKLALKIFKRDRFNHKSPNSAQTESVCAGALEIQLAGDAVYFGELMKKPTIGDPVREVEAEDIVRANRLMKMTSVLCWIAGLVILGGFALIY